MFEGKKILIIEDEKQMIESYQHKFKYKPMLSQAIPYYAQNVAEAVSVIEKEKPDIIYLDLSLGDSSTPEGFEILKKYGKLYNIIVVSGYVDYEQECLALGAKSYMVKNALDFIKMMEQGDKLLKNL